MKVVFHLDSDETPSDVGEADVAVTNEFVKLFVEKFSAKFREVHKISREIVPASITKLLELQMDGYLRETLIDVCAS